MEKICKKYIKIWNWGKVEIFRQNSLVPQNKQKKKLIVNTLEDQDEENA